MSAVTGSGWEWAYEIVEEQPEPEMVEPLLRCKSCGLPLDRGLDAMAWADSTGIYHVPCKPEPERRRVMATVKAVNLIERARREISEDRRIAALMVERKNRVQLERRAQVTEDLVTELADLHSRIRELLGTRELVAYISAERVAALLPPVEGSEPHAEDLRSSAEQLIPVESTAPTGEEK